MTIEQKILIENIGEQPIQYLGEHYYYSLSTDTLYYCYHGVLCLVAQQDLNITDSLILLYSKLYFENGNNNPVHKKNRRVTYDTNP